jgi:hypothetical protein
MGILWVNEVGMDDIRDRLEQEIVDIKDTIRRYWSDICIRLESLASEYLDMQGVAECNSYSIKEYFMYDYKEASGEEKPELVPVDDPTRVDVTIVFDFHLISIERKEVEISVIEAVTDEEGTKMILEPTRISDLAHVEDLDLDPVNLVEMLIYSHDYFDE